MSAPDRRFVTEIIDERRSLDEDWFPKNFAQALGWLNAKLLSVPEAYRETAELDLDYQEYYADLRITYKRPETDDELAVRLGHEARKAKALREAEIRKLEELIGKHPDTAKAMIERDIAPDAKPE